MEGPGSHPHPSRIAWLVLGCMVCQMGAGLFYASRALSPDVIADLGWTRMMWSSGMPAMLFVTSVGQAFVGAACVRFGVRPVLLFAVASLVASMFVLASTRGLSTFYLSMMLLALGNAGVGDVSIGSVITRWFDRGRGLALGLAFVGSNLGAVVFVQAMAMATAWTSWREAAVMVGLAGGALILPFALFVVRYPRPGERPSESIEGEAVVESAEEASDDPIPLSRVLRRPAFWVFFYTVFCYALVQLGLVDHLILYLMDLGYSRAEAAGAFELAVGAGILSKLGAGLLVPRLSARRALILNTLVLMASLVLVPFARDPRVLTLFGLLFGISTAARDVLIPLFVAETFGVRTFATIFGAIMIAYFPGGSVGPLALARVYDVLGSYRPGFTVCVVLVAAAAVGLGFVGRPGAQRVAVA